MWQLSNNFYNIKFILTKAHFRLIFVVKKKIFFAMQRVILAYKHVFFRDFMRTLKRLNALFSQMNVKQSFTFLY